MASPTVISWRAEVRWPNGPVAKTRQIEVPAGSVAAKDTSPELPTLNPRVRWPSIDTERLAPATAEHTTVACLRSTTPFWSGSMADESLADR